LDEHRIQDLPPTDCLGRLAKHFEDFGNFLAVVRIGKVLIQVIRKL
jgi:hypothetical protein